MAAELSDVMPIPARRWLGFFPESPAPAAAPRSVTKEAERVPIPPRQWLEFIPRPASSRALATWGLPAVAVAVAITAIGAVLASRDTSDAGVTNAAVAAPAHDEMIPASAIEPELRAARTVADVPPSAPAPAVDAASAAIAETEPSPTPAPRKRKTLAPMRPGELRKAQRVARQLDAAVAEGRVKTAALSFAVVADDEGTFWSEATTMCNELVVDGVAGWRLPSVGELRDLARARVVPGAAYWSRSRGRDPETRWVYNTRTRHRGAWLAGDPTGATVCVQPRPRAPEHVSD